LSEEEEKERKNGQWKLTRFSNIQSTVKRTGELVPRNRSLVKKKLNVDLMAGVIKRDQGSNIGKSESVARSSSVDPTPVSKVTPVLETPAPSIPNAHEI
jgi:hypothetical protein